MPTLRFAPLLVLAAAAAVAFAQVKIAPAAKAGDQRKYKLEMTLNLGVADATVRSDIKQLVDAVDNGVVKETYSYENFVVELGGAPMDGIEAQPLKVERTLGGIPKKVEGGIPGTDALRTHLLGQFIDPGKALGKGEKAEVVLEESSDKTIPAGKYEITHEGEEAVSEKTTWKYTVKFSEKEPGGLQYNITYWVNPDMSVVKADGKFTDLYVPQAGSNASGTFKMTSL